MSESLNEAFEVRRKSVELEERFVQVALFLDKPPNIEAFRAAFGFAGTEISDDDRYGLRMVNQLLLRMGHLRTAYETAEASRDALDIEAMEREYARVKDINESIHSEFERRGFVQTSQSVEENQRDTARDDVLLSEMSVENPTTTDKGVPVKIRSLEELGAAMQARPEAEIPVPDTDPVTFEKVSLEEWFLAVHTIFNQSDSESLGVSASAESFREAILRVAPLQSDFEHLMQEKVAALQAELERLRAEDVTSTDVKIQEGYISGARHLVKNKALLEALYGAFESEPQVPAEPTDVSIASEVSPAAEPIETNDDSNIQLSERLVSWPRKTGVPNPEYRKLAKEHVEGYTPEELETLKELYRRGDIRAVLPDGKIKPLALICAEYEKNT